MTVSDVQRVLQNLLAERVSIANIEFILEILVDVARTERDHVVLTDLVRRHLSTSICNGLRGNHSHLAVISLDPRIENQIVASVGGGAAQSARSASSRNSRISCFASSRQPPKPCYAKAVRRCFCVRLRSGAIYCA